MNAAPEPLPNDVAALRAMLLAAWVERDAERAETARLAAECDQLAGQNDRANHRAICPDRGTIDCSASPRDYPRSTYGECRLFVTSGVHSNRGRQAGSLF